MATRLFKRTKTVRGSAESSRAPLPYPPAVPLSDAQQLRKAALENHRTLEPSRWICKFTLEQLGLTETVQMLAERLGLWDFLCYEIPTYRRITIEFLSSYEFDRTSRIMTFNLAGHFVRLHTTELLGLLQLSQENVDYMQTTIGFFPDLNEHQFRHYTMHDILNGQRVKNISHPAIRYLQRVLSHSLFARGETASVFNEGDMNYICCMLRRNNNEMAYMPHITYNLAKHIKLVATNLQPGGIVRIGGIISKIAVALNLPTGDDVVPGYTLVDLDGLVRARLIRYDNYHEAWINLGVSNINHRLPLQTALDPMNYATWKIVDPPLEPQEQAPQPPPAQHHGLPYPGQPQGGPTMQQMWDLMQSMNTSLTNLHLKVDAFDERLNEVETHAASASYYAHRGFTSANPDYEDDPPTPPHQRRAARRMEAEFARARAEAEAAQAAQEAEEAAADQQQGDEDEVEEPADNMDAEE